ncbi:MAG: hypothetical protein WBE34_09685 [Candidatus Nitrosopolaris sp.]
MKGTTLENKVALEQSKADDSSKMLNAYAIIMGIGVVALGAGKS